MAGLATQETDRSVSAMIEKVPSPSKRADGRTLLALIEETTGFPPKVWGNDFIIGFGKYTYRRKSGKEEYEWFHVGFAPRKSKITVYLTFDINEHEEVLSRLGKCTWGKGCLYINKLADVDLEVLRELIELSRDARWHQGTQ